MSDPTTAAPDAVHRFQIEVREEELAELHRRIAATRWPRKELVTDRSQGVQPATIQELARYWGTDDDWRLCEAKLNALPQFTTEIDGVDIHFIHVKSPHADALPLIMTHGWPGSVIELLKVVGPLTDPTEVGWDLGRVARAWAELMRRLGYTPLCRAGRRRGRRRHRRSGPPGTRGAVRHPHQPARDGAGQRRRPASGTLGLSQRHLLQQGRQGRPLRRLEEPGLFATEIRAAFRALRRP